MYSTSSDTNFLTANDSDNQPLILPEIKPKNASLDEETVIIL